jgi:hypothetical protein
VTDPEGADLADFADCLRYLRAQFSRAAEVYGSRVDLEARLKAAKEIAKGREADATRLEGDHREDGRDATASSPWTPRRPPPVRPR